MSATMTHVVAGSVYAPPAKSVPGRSKSSNARWFVWDAYYRAGEYRVRVYQPSTDQLAEYPLSQFKHWVLIEANGNKEARRYPFHDVPA